MFRRRYNQLALTNATYSRISIIIINVFTNVDINRPKNDIAIYNCTDELQEEIWDQGEDNITVQ